jgi:hypothetical protein
MIATAVLLTLLAAGPKAEAHLVIGGQKVALAHGRAWRNGESMGVPGVSVILAEKPLTGLDWWKGDSNFAEGQRGIALRVDPSEAPGNERGKTPYRYTVSEDYELKLHAEAFGGWSARPLLKDLEVEDITVSGGRVTGTLRWKGTLANPFDDTQALTGLDATFDLPLEEIGPLPE